MTEIKLTLNDPHSTIASLREGAGDLAPFSAKQVYEVVRQIEEQVKPAIKEPREFGSIVRAGRGGSDRVLWIPSQLNGGHYWESETRIVDVWSELTDVEVLRVGVGDEKARPLTGADLGRMSIEANAAKINAEADAYSNGFTDGSQTMAASVHQRLKRLLQEAITAERKNAYEKAIQAVEELS